MCFHGVFSTLFEHNQFIAFIFINLFVSFSFSGDGNWDPKKINYAHTVSKMAESFQYICVEIYGHLALFVLGVLS